MLALVREDLDLDTPGPEKQSATYMAAAGGHAGAVRVLANAGANLETFNNDSVLREEGKAEFVCWSPLMVAAHRGDLDSMGGLIEAGAELGWLDLEWRTALHIAAAGRPEAVGLLVERGADIDAKDGGGRTPIVHAARCGSDETVDRLRRAGASGPTDGALLAEGLSAAAGRGDLERVATLLGRGASPDGIDFVGYTPLFPACHRGHLAVVDALLAAGADPNPSDHRKATLLGAATSNGHLGVVESLLRAGADPILQLGPDAGVAALSGDDRRRRIAELIREAAGARRSARDFSKEGGVESFDGACSLVFINAMPGAVADALRAILGPSTRLDRAYETSVLITSRN